MRKQRSSSNRPKCVPNNSQMGVRTGIAAAVCLAIYGAPLQSSAAQGDAGATTLEEITVTATRRQQTLEEVPYGISVVSPDQLAASGANDIASLAVQVPGLSMFDYGARFAGATTPIIRGINATGSPARGFRSFEQSPVGTYIGNSPIEGYFKLDDLSRIEVLRGPQGTLYGAGALGGALRLIPTAPVLGAFAASLEAGGSTTSHSHDAGYSAKGMINAPLGDTLAFRASAAYEYEPGWIDTFGILRRTDNSVYGIPLLANPADEVNSSPIYTSRNDWNDQKTVNGRASLRWEPNSAFNAELAYLYAHVTGDGGPQVNLDYTGGVSPFDPATQYPAGGQSRELSLVDQPFHRTTDLVSLDLSYDSGFATISATSSYHETSGSLIQDSTFNYAGFAGGFYLPYYAGVPSNPRFTYPFEFTDSTHTFTQEVRLVSKTGADRPLDYVVGLYYEKQTSHGSWYVTNPGSPARSVAQGCTGYYYYGATFPNCLLLSGPNDVTFQQIDKQNFEDKSVFGELTWHFVPHGQLTVGARHYNQKFTDTQLYQDYTFNVVVPPIPYDAPASKTVWKVNPSYEYLEHHFVYALWSQGFRRGGANSVPATGIFQESPLLRTYQPDETDNYELGLKGLFRNGTSYAFAIFDIRWDHPQISSSLPSGNLAVYNANTAESKGFEFELTGPLGARGLSYSLGYAYADATLTSDFALPANDGYGNIVPGLLSGKSGQQLPGSPKNSLSAALIYDVNLAPQYDLTLSANGVYRDAVALQVAPTLGLTTVQHSSSYEIMNLSVDLGHKPWHTTLLVKNVLDKQEILAPPTQPNQVGNLTNDYLVNSPRTIELRFGYTF